MNRVRQASKIIERAQADLGHLTAGQRRDLLKDNTDWDGQYCDDMVDYLGGAGVHPDERAYYREELAKYEGRKT